MSVREYIGARYVPLFIGEWDDTKTYEPLSIVSNLGNSYTSRQYVPAGVEISNEAYWALTGNYNAQIEQYRGEVAQLANDIDSFDAAINAIKADNWVTTNRIADNAVTENKIADSSIAADKITNSAVTSSKIADSSITTDKIANSAVTNSKIADASIDEKKLANEIECYFRQNIANLITPYMVFTIPKNKYRISIKNNSNTSTNAATSNVYEHLRIFDDYIFAHNCDFFSNDVVYPMRLNNVEFNAAVPFVYYAFAFNTATQEFAVYQPGTYLSNIVSDYDTVFTCSYPLIINGVSQTPGETDYFAPRLAFGWDANNYYVIACEGRKIGEKGLELADIIDIGEEFDITNLYTFDGGGSICVVANDTTPIKLNKVRDTTLEWPKLRNTPLIFGYERI